MRAVLDSGRLNQDVFGAVRGTDGVLKALGGTEGGDGGGLVIGNDRSSSTGTVEPAAVYVRDNRVGVRKAPETGGSAAMDVAGELACSGDLRMYPAGGGERSLRANAASVSLGMRGIARRAYADGRGVLDAPMINASSYYRCYPEVALLEDTPRVTLTEVRTRDDTVSEKVRVIVRFGATNAALASPSLDHLDRARAGDVLRFGESAYRVTATKFYHPAEAAADADIQEGLEVTCEALPEIPYASASAQADVGEALKAAADSPGSTAVTVSRLNDDSDGGYGLASRRLEHAFVYPLTSAACGTAVRSASSGTLRIRCAGSSRIMRHVRGGGAEAARRQRAVSVSGGVGDLLRVGDVRPSSEFADSFDVTLRSSTGGVDMLSPAEDVLIAAAADSGTTASVPLTGFEEDFEDHHLLLAGLTMSVRSHDTTTGVIVFEIADDVYSRDLVRILPYSSSASFVGSGPVVAAVARHDSPYVWLRGARTEEKIVNNVSTTVVVLETYEPSDPDEASAAESLVQLLADTQGSLAEELRFRRVGHEMRVTTTEFGSDGKHLCLRTADGGVPPALREALYSARSHSAAPDAVVVISGPSVEVSRPWKVCDVRPAGSSTTALRLALKRADGADLDATDDAFTGVTWSAGGTSAVRLRVGVYRVSSHVSFDTRPLLTPRGLHIGPGLSELSPSPANDLLSLSGGSDAVIRDGGGIALESDTSSSQRWRLYCDATDRLRLGENTTFRRGGHAEFGGDVRVVGDLTAGALYTPSDARLKTDIRDVSYPSSSSALDLIRDLRVRDFVYRDDPCGRRRTGLVAQEAEAVHAGLTSRRRRHDNDHDHASVDLQELLFLMLGGMQELRRDNAELRSMLQER